MHGTGIFEQTGKMDSFYSWVGLERMRLTIIMMISHFEGGKRQVKVNYQTKNNNYEIRLLSIFRKIRQSRLKPETYLSRYVVIRILADNPGLWFMHCHIEMHNFWGMALMLNESFSRVVAPPPGNFKCGSFHDNVEGLYCTTMVWRIPARLTFDPSFIQSIIQYYNNRGEGTTYSNEVK